MLNATAAHLPQVPQEVPQAILERVERLLSTEDGVFDRSVGQVLAKEITDGLLIDIQGAVNAAADAATPKLSGLARKRLMVWVVIDAVSSPAVLGKAAADKAGGRIWVQAQRVSAALQDASDEAASNRAAARAAAAADSVLEAGLAPSSRRSTRPRRERSTSCGTRSISVSTSWRLLRRRFLHYLRVFQVPAPMRQSQRRSGLMPTRARPPPPAAYGTPTCSPLYAHPKKHLRSQQICVISWVSTGATFSIASTPGG